MPPRGWLNGDARAAMAAWADAKETLEKAATDAAVASRRWVESVRENANANFGRLGRDLAFSQEMSRNANIGAPVATSHKRPLPVTSAPTAKSGRPSDARTPTSLHKPTRKPDIAARALDAALQVDTAVRGAADTLTFGFADEISAGATAAFDFSNRPFRDKFADYHAVELARDQADARERPIARRTGQASGLALSLLAPSSAAAARMLAPRLLSEMRGMKGLAAIPRIRTGPREYAVAAAGAGALNGATQSATDAATGGHGSVGDYLGAVIGGAAATPFAIARSPKSAGAVEGFTTSIAQDLLNGRHVSIDNAMRSSAAGTASSDIADRLGTRWARGLSSTQKGKVGEQLSMHKTRARGYVPNGRGQRLYLSKGFTVLDPASSVDELVESKNGPFVKVSPNQLLAFHENPGRYRFDWWQPSDVGEIAGFGGASLGVHLADDDYP